MKVKTDFVTNSSSTSYICEVCGSQSEQVWDSSDMAEFGFTYCANDHVVCIDHIEDYDEEEMKDDEGYGVKVEHCPICNMSTYSQPELVRYLKKITDFTTEEAFAEVKEVNRRRKKLYDHEYISYVFRKNNWNEEAVMENIRQEFKDHDEFYGFISKP